MLAHSYNKLDVVNVDNRTPEIKFIFSGYDIPSDNPELKNFPYIVKVLPGIVEEPFFVMFSHFDFEGFSLRLFSPSGNGPTTGHLMIEVSMVA